MAITLFATANAHATSCSGHLAACLKQVTATHTDGCKAAFKGCQAGCDKKTNTSTWWGVVSAKAYPADSCK